MRRCNNKSLLGFEMIWNTSLDFWNGGDTNSLQEEKGREMIWAFNNYQTIENQKAAFFYSLPDRVCEWILYRSSFHPDVICYNLLIDAYGQKSQHDKAESTYLDLLEGQCIPTEDTYALLVKAYCVSGLLEKAEAIFAQMRKNGHPSSIIVYNAYIDGLIKGRNSRKVEEIFERMKRDHCQPTTDTYTMDGLCEKAEETFEQLQEAGYEPDVYAYNALLEAYR
ncbi:hypothetical protein HYC85_018984 [Camellia sinensis]|uniref:Pentacotripeptide-repeat region of PRORP domain-containing protein n=1 Tax=Camellia sinensis TaxID=4442 RepID=A0A7J7GWS2_CAMSI|nr:hypothetical protein HYC85_018984 [Camellia sinensis]